VAGAGCAVALVLAVLAATSAGGSNSGYTVRAIFDDAGNLIGGENVKIGGVKVGTVGTVTPTANAKAAVVLQIQNPGYRNFRADASCTILPQGLIGEKFVDCLPTQPRVEGAPLPPPLHKIPNGLEGAGQYLLPVANTSSPVDVDLLGNINRLPERQRLTIIINEFGAGLAGRGSDLSTVIRRADPALRELDKVLAILAGENKTLAKLAVDSDIALQPLAKVRKQFAGFFAESATVAEASAAHRGALEENLAKFPAFLKQLGPSQERLQRFARETIPVFTDLGIAAPAINQAFEQIPAFSRSSTKFTKSLGKTSKVAGPALVATQPLLRRLKTLGGAAAPFSTNLSSLLSSLRNTGGLERLLDFIFLGAGASNGYDQLGHFLRTEGVATTCLKYDIEASKVGCSHKLINTGSSSATPSTSTAASANAQINPATTSLVMARTLAVIGGATPKQALAKYPGNPEAGASELLGAGSPSTPSPSAQPVGGSTAGTTYYSPSSEGSEAGGLLLNYLLGN
jgi:ABC-type transporter Mla subunit MlaD